MSLIPLCSLLADADAAGIITQLLKNEDSLAIVLAFSVPIVAIIVGGTIAITKAIIRHRERMAKIQMGIDPDAPPAPTDSSQNRQ